MNVWEWLVFVAGAAATAATVGSAVRTVILPRGIPARLTRRVFRIMRGIFNLRVGPRASYERRDRVLALYAPLSLLTLIGVWVLIVMTGYTAMFWANGIRPIENAFRVSGSSALTLGFERPADLPNAALAISEAGVALLLLAMMISYLPTIYGIFSRREAFVSTTEVRAGAPPSAEELLTRLWAIGRPDERLSELWDRSEAWFAELWETHTSFPALIFFRSPLPQHSWVTTAGAILDTASLMASTVDRPRDPDAELCIRSGYIALRRIAAYVRVPFDQDPASTDPISIVRSEFDAVCARLAEHGIPMKPDRDQAWRDFAGWRVNYDAPLLGLALLTAAPQAPWSSDRSMARSALALTRRRRIRSSR